MLRGGGGGQTPCTSYFRLPGHEFADPIGTVGHTDACSRQNTAADDRVVTKHCDLQECDGSFWCAAATAEQGDSATLGTGEIVMKKNDAFTLAKVAMLTLAEIKAAVGAFDDGETNVFDALDSVAVAVDAYYAAAAHRREAA